MVFADGRTSSCCGGVKGARSTGRGHACSAGHSRFVANEGVYVNTLSTLCVCGLMSTVITPKTDHIIIHRRNGGKQDCILTPAMLNSKAPNVITTIGFWLLFMENCTVNVTSSFGRGRLYWGKISYLSFPFCICRRWDTGLSLVNFCVLRGRGLSIFHICPVVSGPDGE